MKRSHYRGVIYQLLLGTAEGEHLNPAAVRRALAAKGHRVVLSTVYSQLDVLCKAELIGEPYVRLARRAAVRAHRRTSSSSALPRVLQSRALGAGRRCLGELLRYFTRAGVRPRLAGSAAPPHADRNLPDLFSATEVRRCQRVRPKFADQHNRVQACANRSAS